MGSEVGGGDRGEPVWGRFQASKETCSFGHTVRAEHGHVETFLDFVNTHKSERITQHLIHSCEGKGEKIFVPTAVSSRDVSGQQWI